LCILHIPEESTSLAPQLNYITDIVLELKGELVKIKVSEGDKEAIIDNASFLNQRHKI